MAPKSEIAIKSAMAIFEAFLVSHFFLLLHMLWRHNAWQLWVTTAIYPVSFLVYYDLSSLLIADDDSLSDLLLYQVVKKIVHRGPAGAETLLRCLKGGCVTATKRLVYDILVGDFSEPTLIVDSAAVSRLADDDEVEVKSQSEDGGEFRSGEKDKCSEINFEVVLQEDSSEGEQGAEIGTKMNSYVEDSGHEGEAEKIHGEEGGGSAPVDACDGPRESDFNIVSEAEKINEEEEGAEEAEEEEVGSAPFDGHDGHGESDFVYVVLDEVLAAMNNI